MNPMWQFQRGAQMDSILAEQVQAILIGQTSPADGLATAAEEMNALL